MGAVDFNQVTAQVNDLEQESRSFDRLDHEELQERGAVIQQLSGVLHNHIRVSQALGQNIDVAQQLSNRLVVLSERVTAVEDEILARHSHGAFDRMDEDLPNHEDLMDEDAQRGREDGPQFGLMDRDHPE